MGSCLSVCGGKASEAKKASAFQTTDERDKRTSSEGGLSHVDDLRDSEDASGVAGSASSLLDGGSAGINNNNNGASSSSTNASPMDSLDAERLKNLREEQARLDLLVATVGRDMVGVRSTRGSTGYYDQGFAAALAQHLEQTTEFPNQLPQRLPPAPTLQQDLLLQNNNAKNNNTSSSSSPNNNKNHAKSTTNRTNNNNNNNNNATNSSSSASALYAILSQPMWEGIVLGPSREGLAGCAGENPSRYMDRVAESILDAVVPTKEELFAGLGPMVEDLL